MRRPGRGKQGLGALGLGAALFMPQRATRTRSGGLRLRSYALCHSMSCSFAAACRVLYSGKASRGPRGQISHVARATPCVTRPQACICSPRATLAASACLPACLLPVARLLRIICLVHGQGVADQPLFSAFSAPQRSTQPDPLLHTSAVCARGAIITERQCQNSCDSPPQRQHLS